MQSAIVEQIALDLVIADVVRDSSVTSVAICTLEPVLLPKLPILRAGAVSVNAAGGVLEYDDRQAVQWVFYPAIDQDAVTLELEGEVLALASFAERQRVECTLPETRVTRWVACESLMVVEWETDLQFASKELLAIDGAAVDGDAEGQPLGFYNMGVSDGQSGLVLTIGFQRPSHDQVSIILTTAHLQGESVDVYEETTIPTRGDP